jgi:ABC-type dipeptide/oligopeptide/nickel transport system permease subunit
MSNQYLYEKSPTQQAVKHFFGNRTAMIGFWIIIFANVIAFAGYLIMPDDTPNAAEGGSSFLSKTKPWTTITLLKERKDKEIEKVSLFTKLLEGQESEFSEIYPISEYKVIGDTVLIFKLIRKARLPESGKGRRDRDSTKRVGKGDFEDSSMFAGIGERKTFLDFVRPIYVGGSATSIFREEIKKSPLFREDTLVYPNVTDTTPKSYAYKDTLFYSFIRDRYYYRADTVVYLDPNGKLKFTTKAELEKEFKTKSVEERTFYLGTDKSGRDILSRIILGTRVSLSIGFLSVFISLLVGVTLGATAGYYRGMLDNIVMWIMTVVWSIPSIMLVIAISLVLGNRGIWVVFVSIGFTIWVDIARIVRGEVMSIKQKLYIESARAFGLSNFTIIYRHILPNLFGSIIVILFSNFASAILMEAGLSFLGIGVPIPMPSWGNMLQEGSTEATQSFLVLIPSLCIIVLVLAFNLIGNGLRDALDPKNMKR